jgi:uncharacterized protein YcbK (DUF882 family)
MSHTRNIAATAPPIRPALALVLTLAFALTSCSIIRPSPEARYKTWHAGHASEVLEYQAFLQRDGSDDTVPMHALLRTARRWRLCGNREFATPPPELWPNMLPTLRVVAQLRDAGILDTTLARSVYRDEAMNTCAGGSSGSKHRENRAIDFDLPPNTDNVTRLCEFWRTQGPALNLGLGFYTPTAIHLDTAGFRTWGSDHHRGTSLCITEAPL